MAMKLWILTLASVVNQFLQAIIDNVIILQFFLQNELKEESLLAAHKWQSSQKPTLLLGNYELFQCLRIQSQQFQNNYLHHHSTTAMKKWELGETYLLSMSSGCSLIHRSDLSDGTTDTLSQRVPQSRWSASLLITWKQRTAKIESLKEDPVQVLKKKKKAPIIYENIFS